MIHGQNWIGGDFAPPLDPSLIEGVHPQTGTDPVGGRGHLQSNFDNVSSRTIPPEHFKPSFVKIG